MYVTRREVLLGASGITLLTPPLRMLAAASWTERTPLPYRVQEIYPALHQDRIWVAGGISPDAPEGKQDVSDRVVVYDPKADAWSEGPPLPEPRHHGYLVSHDGRLYLFGGFVIAGGGRWSASRDVLMLSDDERWTKLATMPAAQCETVAAAYAGRIHLASGRNPTGSKNAEWRDQGDVDLHQMFDPATKSWETAPPIATARNSAASAVVGERWNVIGGRTVEGGNLAAHEVYDFASGRWEAAQPMPQAQGGLAAAALDGSIFVFGGEYFDRGRGVYAEIWEYDTEADRWQQAGTMPVPRHGLGAVTVGDGIYVVAGAAAAGAKGTTDRNSLFRP